MVNMSATEIFSIFHRGERQQAPLVWGRPKNFMSKILLAGGAFLWAI
jgi:hypothetical protein